MLLIPALGFALVCTIACAEPVVFEPSGQWQGDDGPWSTFKVTLGSPSQIVSVLPAPYRNALVVVSPEACPPDAQLSSCAQDRGGVFEHLKSQTWHGVEASQWDPFETLISAHPRQNITPGHGMQQSFSEPPVGPLVTNKYGIDVVENTAKNGRAWKVPDQGVLSVGHMSPFVGLMGLGTNYNGSAKYPVSFFDNVRSVSAMKSISWSYTAGNKDTKAPGSLVFGGYDESRIDKAAMVKYAMHRDSRAVSVQIGNITVSDASQPGPQSIGLPSAFAADLDFTTPYLTLPEQIYLNLERMLGITWDSSNALYRISESRHQELVNTKANITLTIVGDAGQQHDFRIPYASLVLDAKFPLVDNATKYFAVQRASREATQFTLGRAFFQEAHMTAVFDDPAGSYFKLAPAIYDPNVSPKIVEIETPGFRKPHRSSNGAAIAGSVIAALVLLAIIGYLVFARKTRRFPFAASAPRKQGDDEDARSLSDLASDSRKIDAPAESRASRTDSVYYEALDELPIADSPNATKRASVEKG